MGEVLKCVHMHNSAQQVLIEGADGEGTLDIFTDLVACFWERYFLCALSGQGLLQEVYLMNWPFVFMSCFESSPSCFGGGSTPTFKFDVDLFAGINTPSNKGPGMTIIGEPVLMCAWLKRSGSSRGITLNVVKKAIAHQMDEYVLIPLMVVPFCFTQLFASVRSTQPIEDNGWT